MLNRDREAEPSAGWLPQIDRLAGAATSFNDHVIGVTGAVEQGLSSGCFVGPADQVPRLIGHLSAVSIQASCVVSHVDSLVDMATYPSALLVDDRKSGFVSSDFVVGSVGSVLCSAASMAGAIRSSNGSVHIGEHGGVEGLQTGGLFASRIQVSEILLDPLSQDAVVRLGSRLEQDSVAFGSLVDTSLATSRLNAEIYAQPVDRMSPYLKDVNSSFVMLNELSKKVYDDLMELPPLDTGSFLFQAPTIQPYASTRATAVVSGIDESTLDLLAVPAADGILDGLGDDLATRLEAVNPGLADVYQEGIAAIQSGHQGWIRHASVSFRTLFDYLLRDLAPDRDLRRFFEDPDDHMIDGEFRRSARLRYVFRDVATGAYAQMAEQDIKLAEATFFPTNAAVHRLASPLSDKQMRILWRRIQGCVSVVLEAADY